MKTNKQTNTKPTAPITEKLLKYEMFENILVLFGEIYNIHMNRERRTSRRHY